MIICIRLLLLWSLVQPHTRHSATSPSEDPGPRGGLTKELLVFGSQMHAWLAWCHIKRPSLVVVVVLSRSRQDMIQRIHHFPAQQLPPFTPCSFANQTAVHLESSLAAEASLPHSAHEDSHLSKTTICGKALMCILKNCFWSSGIHSSPHLQKTQGKEHDHV